MVQSLESELVSLDPMIPSLTTRSRAVRLGSRETKERDYVKLRLAISYSEYIDLNADIAAI